MERDDGYTCDTCRAFLDFYTADNTIWLKRFRDGFEEHFCSKKCQDKKDFRLKAHEIYHTFLRPGDMKADKEGCLKKAYEAGMIPKSDYVVGRTYYGHCRNAEEAIWTGNRFEYQRYKFGIVFPDSVEAPEDDTGFDIFVPVDQEIK
jgi:hypothetical protein